MSPPFRALHRVALGIWCFSMAGHGISVPLTDHETSRQAPAAASTPYGDLGSRAPALDTDVLTAPDDTDTTAIPSNELIGEADRKHLAEQRPNEPLFTSPEDAIDDIVFDRPAKQPLFSDDEALMNRMRGVRDSIGPMLNEVDASINRAGRELLDHLGIEDTATTHLMNAQARHGQVLSQWDVQAAGKSNGSNPLWEEDSARNTLGKLLFLIWDTLTHPVLITLVILVGSGRLMIALVRLSSNRHTRRRRTSRSSPTAAPPTTQAPSKHRSRRRVR